MELYSRINEVGKVTQASNIHTSNGRYKLIILSICKMADGVLTSSLGQAMGKLFFGTQALPKNRGHVLTPDFGMVKNLFKIASNGEVIDMKKFRIVDMNIFEVWVIAVRFHLDGRNYTQSTKI